MIVYTNKINNFVLKSCTDEHDVNQDGDICTIDGKMILIQYGDMNKYEEVDAGDIPVDVDTVKYSYDGTTFTAV